MAARTAEDKAWRLAAWGLFLLLLGVYWLSHPGRIDTIDGQHRFNVARNLIDFVGPIINDYYLIKHPLPTNPNTGLPYSFYNLPGSASAIPAMILTRAAYGADSIKDQWAYSVSVIPYSALIAPVFLVFLRGLGACLRDAILLTLLLAFATLWWNGAVTVLDQNQHGLFLLIAAYLAWRYGLTRRIHYALLAGLSFGVLVFYKETYLVLLPAIIWLLADAAAPGSTPKERLQQSLFGISMAALASACVAVVYFWYNWIRFGSPLMPEFGAAPVWREQPISGFLALTISPGKSVLLFSPILILGLLGFKDFRQKHPTLAMAIVFATIGHVALISSLMFVGGDYCWGPRYLLPLMPLWMLMTLPLANRIREKFWIKALVVASVFSQLLGLSLDNYRFFYYLNDRDRFWVDPWIYFKESQFFGRFLEINEVVTERNFTRSKDFESSTGEVVRHPVRPVVYPVNLGKAPSGLVGTEKLNWANKRFQEELAEGNFALVDQRKWMEDYKVLYLPRPYWGWAGRVEAKQVPLDLNTYLAAGLATTGMGFVLTLLSTRRRNP